MSLRRSPTVVGVFALATGLGLGGVTSVSSAVPATHPVVGIYQVTVDWTNPVIKTSYSLALFSNGADADSYGDTGKWSTTGRQIKFKLKSVGVTAKYIGKITNAGLNNPSKPGTMSNTKGNSGTWYAVYGSSSSAVVGPSAAATGA
jgi:hypothetical protein